MDATLILDGIELAVKLIEKLRDMWSAQGMAPDDFDALVRRYTDEAQKRAKQDADVELAGAGGAGA